MFMLSERFIMALCTKPPIPFVGEAGRSLAELRRACEDDIVGVRPSVVLVCSVSALDAVSDTEVGGFEKSLLRLLWSESEVVVDILLLQAPLSLPESSLVGSSEVTLSGAGLMSLVGSIEPSLDMPGRPLRPPTTLSEPFESSLLRLYAALPMPRSAVCLKNDGSLAPRDAAI